MSIARRSLERHTNFTAERHQTNSGIGTKLNGATQNRKSSPVHAHMPLEQLPAASVTQVL